MSRIGKKPIMIPSGVEVNVANGVLVVKGPKGELRKRLHSLVTLSVADGQVTVAPVNDSHFAHALWGTFASHTKNLITGVTEGYQKQLIVEGIGYKASLNGSTLVLDVGFSHSVELPVPEGLEVSVEKNTITVKGIDKEKVGQFAAEIRAVKKPEPYKGKGIRYADEVIRRKEGKRVAG